MEFKKFNSLENTYRQNLIDKVQYEGKDGGEWVVTEKIHGANFSFWCDGKEVKVASRTQFVDGTFYNCQAVINRYEEAIKNIHKCWKYEENQPLIIYGELFGGNIQKEVQYGEKDFRVFDVVFNGFIQQKDKNLVEYLEEFGLKFAPVLYRGTFKECMEVKNTFRSTLTPEGYEGENNAEGVVIEPVVPAFFNNGSRIYFKNKTPSFSEKNSSPKEKKVFELSEEESDILNAILVYATENRVSNVISKIGEVTNKDFGKILGLTIQDMLEDYIKDDNDDPKKSVEDNWKDFHKLLSAEVSKVVRTVFLTKLEN